MDSVSSSRQELSAAFRWSHRLGLSEGVDNHFSVAIGEDQFLVNPVGMHWSAARASDLLLVNAKGEVLDGKGQIEPTAFYIHRAVHRYNPNAICVLHTHMPYATAIACVEGGRLEPIHQNAARLEGQISYCSEFDGLALDAREGEQIARHLNGRQVLLMANHGVMVVGTSVAGAFDTLYFLERACQLQIIALSTGRPLRLLSDETVRKTAAQFASIANETALAHFSAIQSILNREEPEFAL